MKFKFEYIFLSIATLIIIAFGISVLKTNTEVIHTSAEPAKISNEKICWGLKRAKDHKQPDLGQKNIKLIEEYKGIAIGREDSKNVYLTFDNGYEAGYTSKILDVLKENNVTATFFITGHYLNTASDLVKRMIDEGHIVGNHTVNHPSLPEISDEKIKAEVMNLHTTMIEKIGYEMKYIRPPKGEYSERVLGICKSLGYRVVMWSLAYDDWDKNKQGREEYGKQKILENIHPGAVILLHATSKDNSEILDYCIKEIKNMGYEFKSLDEFD